MNLSATPRIMPSSNSARQWVEFQLLKPICGRTEGVTSALTGAAATAATHMRAETIAPRRMLFMESLIDTPHVGGKEVDTRRSRRHASWDAHRDRAEEG